MRLAKTTLWIPWGAKLGKGSAVNFQVLPVSGGASEAALSASRNPRPFLADMWTCCRSDRIPAHDGTHYSDLSIMKTRHSISEACGQFYYPTKGCCVCFCISDAPATPWARLLLFLWAKQWCHWAGIEAFELQRLIFSSVPWKSKMFICQQMTQHIYEPLKTIWHINTWQIISPDILLLALRIYLEDRMCLSLGVTVLY